MAELARQEAVMGVGRDHERGSEPQPQGPWSAEPGATAPMGAEHLQARGLQGFNKGQTQTRRVERQLPRQVAHPGRPGSNAIALGAQALHLDVESYWVLVSQSPQPRCRGCFPNV